MGPRTVDEGTRAWSALVLATSMPLLTLLCAALWWGPFPIREVVGLFADLEERSPWTYFAPETSYYRPLFHLALSAIWNGAPSSDAALAAVRLLHIVPLVALVLLAIRYLRPRTAIDAAAATVAMAVLIGAPGLLGNLEPPLSYTIVGMPTALLVLVLAESAPRWWHGTAIVGLTLLAVGFKEQGLVIVPLVMVAWWMGAPGVTRRTAAALTGLAVIFVLFRIGRQGADWPLFEQDVGYGFTSMSSTEAADRFGRFPLWIYAYSGASTVANVLFAEPTDGVFRFVAALRDGRWQPWQLLYLASSTTLTGLIAWWGARTLRRDATTAWSPEARLVIVLTVVLAGCGALSFDYSRDRLGGMAVPFYACAAYFSVRAAATRAAQASRVTTVVAVAGLMLLATAWQLRAVYTLEFTRQRTVNSQREWLTDLRRRRVESETRPAYQHVLEALVPQGTTPAGPIHRTAYPRWLYRLLGES